MAKTIEALLERLRPGSECAPWVIDELKAMLEEQSKGQEPTIEQIAHDISQQPVGYQYQDRDGNWKPFISEKHYQDTLADGSWPIRPVFARPFLASIHETIIDNHNRLVRELDVLWNGESGAAKQASLCDMVSQIGRELPALRAAPAGVPDLVMEVARKIASEFQEAEAVRFEPFRDFYKDPGVIGGKTLENSVGVRITLLRALTEMLSAAPADAVAKDAGCECHRCIKDNDLRGPSGFFPLNCEKMILCPKCGNKRCPHASDHRLECTGSNEPGQPGSIYAAMQGEEAATVAKGCHRSHPHEDMGPECQRKTIEARQQFMAATGQAPYLIHGEPDALEQGEPA